MKTQKNNFFLLVTVLIIQLVQCTCNNNYYNEFVSKLRLKRDSTIEQNFHSNMSLHRNLHYLPENIAQNPSILIQDDMDFYANTIQQYKENLLAMTIH
ncbi:hypothetical protein CVS40_11061 [Lucilia cuprina]|nr:hypothetical protein CVS40_11061 [Lucilia cuprina]